MWQVMQDLCNWPLELTVLTAMGKMVSEVFPKSPGYLGQLEGVLVKAWWECLLVWTYLGYPEGSGGQACSQEQHPLPPSLPCFGVCSGNFGGMSDGLMLLPGNPSLCWYPLWPAAFPLIFVLLVLLWLGSNAGGCSSLTGRQWKADLGCVCAGWWLHMNSNSKVTRWQLCHISCWHALHGQHYSSPCVPVLACFILTGQDFSLQACHFPAYSVRILNLNVCWRWETDDIFLCSGPKWYWKICERTMQCGVGWRFP